MYIRNPGVKPATSINQLEVVLLKKVGEVLRLSPMKLEDLLRNIEHLSFEQVFFMIFPYEVGVPQFCER